MEEYRRVIKKRVHVCLILGIVLIPVAIVNFYPFFNMDSILTGSEITEFFGGVLNGIRGGAGMGFSVLFFTRAIMYQRAIKDDTKMKKYYIEEYDERNIALNELSSKTSFNVIIYVLIVACIITGLINTTISLTLLAVLCFIVLCRMIIYNIYSNKI